MGNDSDGIRAPVPNVSDALDTKVTIEYEIQLITLVVTD